ncbi:MAG: RDD family protein [Methanospirillaceae archaeon]|nr:RDD family protein [Methanospirillaceae archaeon]
MEKNFIYSSFWRRTGAFLIDIIILILIALIVGAYLGFSLAIRMINQMIHHQPVTDTSGTIIISIVPMPVVTAFLVTIVLIPWLYFAALESSQNQATLGKMTLRIIVTDLKGERITFTRATLRHFSKWISFLLVLSGFFCILYTKKHQGLHDLVAACLVLLRPPINQEEISE